MQEVRYKEKIKMPSGKDCSFICSGSYFHVCGCLFWIGIKQKVFGVIAMDSKCKLFSRDNKAAECTVKYY